MKRITATLFVVAAMLVYLAPSATAAPPERSDYIVVLHDDEPSPAAAAREVAAQAGGDVGFVYHHALKGFSITVPAQAVSGIERNPRVKYVEADQPRYAFGQTIPTGIQRIYAAENTDGTSGNYNTAIDIDGSDDYRVDVDVAVIDTGIDLQHPDLNVLVGVNCTGRISNTTCLAGGDDDNAHGTHVAGTIGALDNGDGVVGVAPGARLWPVKVLNSRGSGWSSWIIAGIDWVANPVNEIEVANMSLGGAGFSQAEYDAIQGAVDNGVAFAVAAGNEDADAINYSPGGFDNVLSVSALADFDGLPGRFGAPTCRDDQDDTLADFSNWGSAVDIAAPGVCIYSTLPLEQGGYGTMSGTSMASPHAAGALALLASVDKPSVAADVYSLYSQVENAGNYEWTDDSGDGIKEPLLVVSTFTPALVSTGGVPNTAPSVTITSPTDGSIITSGTTIYFKGSATDIEDGNLTDSLVWTSDPDGVSGNGGSFSSTILNDGKYTITATATDSGGLIGSASVAITVSSGSVSKINLTVTTRTKAVNKYADLRWSGAVSSNVDIYRDGTFIVTTPNDTFYTDKVAKTTTTATYKVCESGTATCSNEVLATW
jgi:subtilisin